MTTDIRMPALTSTMEEAAVLKWLVSSGDSVRAGQPVAEVETDKATMEIEAPVDGVIADIMVAAGPDPVKVNVPLARISRQGEASEMTVQPSPAAKGSTVQSEPQTSGTAVKPRGRDVENKGRILSSPLARMVARNYGVDLSAVAGTGPRGRILRRDVEAALDAKGAAGDTPKVPGSPAEFRPHTAMRRTIASRLTASARDIPHFSIDADCEVDRLINLKETLAASARAAGSGTHSPTLNDFVVRAVALALMMHPDMNVSWEDDGLRVHRNADIAVAVSVDGGLMTPVVRNANERGISAVAQETRTLISRARTGKLKPADYEGGSFTISNLGMFGVRRFDSIINPPHAAILSVGAASRRPVAKPDGLGVANVMTLTLTVDHRAVDGATAAQFLDTVGVLLKDPYRLML